MSEQPAASGLDAIAQRHAENEGAMRMAKAVRGAEFVLLGASGRAREAELREQLATARATLVSVVGPETRFVIAGDDVGFEALVEASDGGALLVRPDDIAQLVEAYVAVWTPAALKEASRRAREEARQLALGRARGIRARAEQRRGEAVAVRTSRMASRRAEEEAPTRRLHRSEAERKIQDAARDHDADERRRWFRE